MGGGVKRNWLGFLTVALLALGFLPAAAHAGNTVKHVGSLQQKDVAEEGGCQRTTLFQWSELPGATSYTLSIDDTGGFGFTKTYPPYDAESEGPFGGLEPVAKGQHRQALTYQAGPGCDSLANDLARFTVTSFTATFDEKSRIVGTVTEPDETPIPDVAISISGAGKAKTNSGGAYGAKVEKGRHTVSAPDGFCVRGSNKCKNSTTVNVPQGGTEAVHFVPSPPGRIVGTVRVGCDGRCSNAVVPDAEVSASPVGGRSQRLRGISATSDEDGHYELDVPRQGEYKVQARYPGMRVKPGRKTVTVGGKKSRGRADFRVCGLTGMAPESALATRRILGGTWTGGLRTTKFEGAQEISCQHGFSVSYRAGSKGRPESVIVTWIGQPICSNALSGKKTTEPLLSLETDVRLVNPNVTVRQDGSVRIKGTLPNLPLPNQFNARLKDQEGVAAARFERRTGAGSCLYDSGNVKLLKK